MARKPQQEENPVPPPEADAQRIELEPELKVPEPPPAAKRLEMAFFLVLLEGARGLEIPERRQFDQVAQCLEDFVLANPDAPHVALQMQIKMKLKLAFCPDMEPRTLQLVLKLFRECVLGLAAIRAEDAEAERLRLAAEAAKVPGHVRDDERAVKPTRGPFDPSDFARSLPKHR